MSSIPTHHVTACPQPRLCSIRHAITLHAPLTKLSPARVGECLVPNAFTHSLTRSFCLLAHLNRNMLNKLAPLTYLSLENTELQDIPFPLPATLKALFLGHNRIESLPAGAFAGLSNLQILDLGHNRITSIAPGAFDGLRSLRFVNLDNNRLSVLSNGSFAGLPRLEQLSIRGNLIGRLVEGSFDGLRSLQYLSLRANCLEQTLTRRLLVDLTALRGLDLNSNNMTAFEPHVVPVPRRLQYL